MNASLEEQSMRGREILIERKLVKECKQSKAVLGESKGCEFEQDGGVWWLMRKSVCEGEKCEGGEMWGRKGGNKV
jgi:hypothetical protein